MTSNSDSELWKSLPWKKFRKNLFRLQCRLWKAVRVGDRKRINNLQKLILKSRSARLLAIRQVTQLNLGKKTAGVDGKASLTYKERVELDKLLMEQVNTWTHSKLREIPVATCNTNRSNLQSKHFQTRIKYNYNYTSARINCN